MKVILDCERMKYPFTGLYEYCYQLGSALQEYLDKDSLSYYIPEKEINVFGDQYTYYQRKSSHKILPPMKMDADIWHSVFQTTKFMKGKNNLKKVLTIHDLNFLYEKSFADKIEKYKEIVQKNIDRADYLIAISHFAKQDVLDNLNVKGKPFDVIYNGCNIFNFEGFEGPLIYKPEKPFLFFIGNVIPKKNVHVLPCLLKGNDYELVISGIENATYKEKILEEAKRWNVEDRVKITGPISIKEKYWYFKNCLAFMFPSLAEGFGLPPIEAMHFGKPVFLSMRTSLPEVGGDVAYYFENFEPEHMQAVFEASMSDYFANTKEKEQALIARSELFSWRKCAADHFRVYNSLTK